MEPKLPAPNLGPEMSPVNYGQNMERFPQPSTPERPSESINERLEHPRDMGSGTPPPAVLPIPVSVPLPTSIPQSGAQTASLTDDTPITAGDEDLIEKEWVDKAKKIITQTKDDPYRREQEVSKLQADYLRKRYGKDLGASQ